MVIKCSAIGCTNRHNKDNPNLHFHRYPLNKPELLRQWVAASREEGWKPTKTSFLCSEHFTAESYLTPLTPGRTHLKHNAVPTLFNLQQSSRKKRKAENIVISPLKVERKEDPQERTEVTDDEVFADQSEVVEEQKETEESVSEAKEELQDLQLITFDVDILTLAKLCDETFSNFIVLPSSLWGMHVEHGGTFVAFSHLSKSTSDSFVMTDKVVLIEEDLVPKVFVRGRKVITLPSYLTSVPLQTFAELNEFLQELESLLVCAGTGISLNASFSEKCSLYLGMKQRGIRCLSCSALRNRLKRCESQRQRRAGIKAGKSNLQTEKNLTLRIICEEEADCDEKEMQEQDEMEESNEESANNET